MLTNGGKKPMTPQELQEAARRQPFEAFRVILTTGATYDIHHLDLIMVGRRSAILGMTNEPNGTTHDRTSKVDLLHVVGIEELPVSPSSTNGPTA
jgi:hypothetical protein